MFYETIDDWVKQNTYSILYKFKIYLYTSKVDIRTKLKIIIYVYISCHFKIIFMVPKSCTCWPDLYPDPRLRSGYYKNHYTHLWSDQTLKLGATMADSLMELNELLISRKVWFFLTPNVSWWNGYPIFSLFS